tara:strand:- start:3141 stop:3536 length:396 start_codon:yes stop_codon:yes gene_type:complete
MEREVKEKNDATKVHNIINEWPILFRYKTTVAADTVHYVPKFKAWVYARQNATRLLMFVRRSDPDNQLDLKYGLARGNKNDKSIYTSTAILVDSDPKHELDNFVVWTLARQPFDVIVHIDLSYNNPEIQIL